MKMFSKLLGLMLLSLFLFSCRGSGDGGNTEEGYYFRARVNGTNFTANSTLTESAKVANIGGVTSLDLYGIRDNKEKIELHFMGYTDGVTGSFPFEFQNANLTPILIGYYKDTYNANPANSYGGGTGVLIITENKNGKIRGTFAFKAKNENNEQVTISEGQFYLPLSQ